MADDRSSSKIGPQAVAPVVHENVRYSVGKRRETKNWYQMGYVEARGSDTGNFLWERLVYEVDYQAGKETDVQEVYITSLCIVDGELEVGNERREIFRINLKDQSVRKLR